MTEPYPVHGRINGPIVMIGFGSLGRGVLPLIERHLEYDSLTVIDPKNTHKDFLNERGINFVCDALTKENYVAILKPMLTRGGFCLNLSVDAGSFDIMRLCREVGALYLDTSVEPWPGFYFADEKNNQAARTNYVLREKVLDEKRKNPGGPTAVSCCGANPGMVSWLLKQALLTIADDTGVQVDFVPRTREAWAKLMQTLGVKGIHIAERDTQRAVQAKSVNTFVNTWSVDGFISEGLQPAELGWGTHETWMPPNAHRHADGCKAAILLDQPGAMTKVHTWCPTLGPQYGLLVTHNEAISISDYYTVGEGDHPEYRPTCHYAYHPCDLAVSSLHEMLGSGKAQDKHQILNEDEILDGTNELGVLLFGHKKNAYWYGSRLNIEDARKLAPFQNATGLQVTSAVLAGMVWAIENPNAGIVETDEMDFERCFQVQKQYLGHIEGHYTNWTPLTHRWSLFDEELDESDPWSFKNILAS